MSAGAALIEDPGRNVQLEVLIEGSGPDVVLVPSAMRGAADFAHLQAALAAAGYRSVAINPRGVRRSTPPPDDFTLGEAADDVALVISGVCHGPAHVVGHALGNIFARATATYRPEVVKTLAVMPCGGHNLLAHPVAPEVIAHVARCHDEALSEEERVESLRVAFFAPGNDPKVWLDGWWPASSGLAKSALSTDPEEWWRGGTVPMLIVQPLDDAMASPAAGREVAAALGNRATYVEVPGCGHAILPEQPETIAGLIITFLRAHP